MSISCRIEPLQQRFPKVRVYQDWREMLKKERGNIDSVNVSIPDHMHCAVALEAMKLGKPVYVQKPLCNTLRETRLLTEEARRRGLTTQMGIQVSSSRAQRYGEALVRSGIVGKIREVHTFSNKSWGDDKPLPDAGRSGARAARLGRLGRRERAAPVQARRLSPGRVAPARRIRDRHARRHGLPHLQPAVSRAEADVARLGHRVRPVADARKAGRRRRA